MFYVEREREECVLMAISLNMAGIRKTIKLMKHLEIRFSGIEHYLLAKAQFTTLLKEKERRPESSKSEESSEECNANEEEAEEEKQPLEITLEDLEPTLEACRECYAISIDHGSRAMYLVNGVLLRTPVSLGVCRTQNEVAIVTLDLSTFRKGCSCLQSF